MFNVKFSGSVGSDLTSSAAGTQVQYLADTGSDDASAYPLLYVVADLPVTMAAYVGTITSAVPSGYTLTIDLLFDGEPNYPTPPNAALPPTILQGPIAAGTAFNGGTGVMLPLNTTVDVRVTTSKNDGVTPPTVPPALSLSLFTTY